MPNILNTSKYGDLDISKARTDASQFGDGSTYALTFNVNGKNYTYVPSNVAQNGGLTAGDNTYLLPYFTSQDNLNSFSKAADKVDLSGSGVEGYLKNQGLSTQGFIIPSDQAGFDSQVLTQPTSTLNGSLNGLKKEGDQIVYGVTGGGGSRYLTPSGEVHDPTITYSSILGDVFGSAGQDLANAWQSLGPVGQIAAAYYGGGAIADALGAAPAAGSAVAESAPAFTGELPAGYAGYTAPEVTTLGTVAGPTEGMGTQLSSMGENAYTAAQDAQDALAMQGNPAANATLGSVAGIGAATAYPALNAAAAGTAAAAGMTPAQIAAAAGATGAGSALGSLTGSALGDMAAISGATGLGGALLSSNAAQNAADVQAAAANKAIAQQQANFELINKQQAPYRAAGYGALNQLAQLGSGQTQTYDASGNPIGAVASPTDYLTHQFNAADLKAGLAPNYDFMLQQGQMANQRAANAAGGGLSGNALQGLQKYTQDYAGNAYQNAFNNYQTQRQNIYNTLAGIAGIGQTGQNATNAAATNATNAATQLGVGSAAAQAGATAGTGNAYANALNNVGQNYTLASLLNQRGNVQMPTA